MTCNSQSERRLISAQHRNTTLKLVNGIGSWTTLNRSLLGVKNVYFNLTTFLFRGLCSLNCVARLLRKCHCRFQSNYIEVTFEETKCGPLYVLFSSFLQCKKTLSNVSKNRRWCAQGRIVHLIRRYSTVIYNVDSLTEGREFESLRRLLDFHIT